MNLPVSLQKRIIDYLISMPNMHDSDSQRALIYHAGLDQQLQTQIPFGKPPAQFVPLLVLLLKDYGKIHEGHHALEVVLESTKSYVGQDKQDICDNLLQELSNIKEEKETLISKSLFLNRKKIVIITFMMILLTSIYLHRYYFPQRLQHLISVALPSFQEATDMMELPGSKRYKFIYLYNRTCPVCDNVEKTLDSMTVSNQFVEQVDFIRFNTDYLKSSYIYGINFANQVPLFILVDSIGKKVIKSSAYLSLDAVLYIMEAGLSPHSKNFVIETEKGGDVKVSLEINKDGSFSKMVLNYSEAIEVSVIFENNKIKQIVFTNHELKEVKVITMEYFDNGKTMQFTTSYGHGSYTFAKPFEHPLISLLEGRLSQGKFTTFKQFSDYLAGLYISYNEDFGVNKFSFNKETGECQLVINKAVSNCKLQNLPELILQWIELSTKLQSEHIWGIDYMKWVKEAFENSSWYKIERL